MEEFNKKKSISTGGIIGILIAIGGIIGVLANMTEIVGFFEGHKKKSADEPQKVIEQNIDEEKEIPAELPAEITPEPATEANYVWLDKMPVTDSQRADYPESATDTVGNTYFSHFIKFSSRTWPTENGFIIYYPGKQYNLLTGKICISNETTTDTTGEIVIYSNDELIYSTGTIGKATAPIEINLDISECDFLKFYTTCTYNYSSIEVFNVLLTDFKLEK